MDNSIKELMLEEHRRVRDILDSFEILVKENLNKAKEEFSKFKWALEKHFFVEEKVVFIISDKLVGDEISYIFDLMQEHGSIIELVNNVGGGLKNNVTPNNRGVTSLLKRHAVFEDSYFYPKLDEILSAEQKKEISERVKEVIRG
jgi:hemerythrin-like domain-containing protein